VIRGFASATRGATLIENMVALLLGSVTMISLYAYFRSEIYHALIVETRIAVLEDARGALDIMLRDLKNAGSWGSGSVPVETGVGDDPSHDADSVCNRVYAASAAVIHVQMDLNGNGTCADLDPRENIRYELGGPTAACPGSRVLRRNGDCLLANVVPAAGEKVFTFFDRSGVDLGSAPVVGAIKRIRIEFSVQAKNPDPKILDKLSSTLSSSVELRN
jgi:type II secretory pathway component PulJ